MNRWKREELRKKQKAREDLSESEIRALDIQDAIDEATEQLGRKYHTEMFPEEYEFMYDDPADYKARKQGHNPMSAEYIERIENKRHDLGVAPLSESGRSQSDDTWKHCQHLARDRVEELRTRIDEILFYNWDPLCFSHSNWNRWEYESYVPKTLLLALTSDSPRPIADYLTKVSTEYMLMDKNRKRDEQVAKLIHAIATNTMYMPSRKIIEVE